MSDSTAGRRPGFPILADHDVVRAIASGGMGAVLEVRDRRTGVARAAKVVHRADDPIARARFRREAELLARCDRHPGIVKVHAFGESEGHGLYMILDLVTGEDLQKRLEREGRLEVRGAATLARDLARALGFMHERGIVHRDVKPSNVLLDASDSFAPRLTDFGLATARDVDRLTRSGQFVGTIAFCAPEQALSQPVGPPVDVFSLGAILFQALAGEPPMTGDTALELLGQLADERPIRDVRTVNPEVPEPLARLLARALEKDPRRRYPDAGQLAAELDRFLEGKPVVADARTKEKRNRPLAALALLAVLSVLALGAAFVALGRRREAGRVALEAARARVERARSELSRLRREAPAPVSTAAQAALAGARLDAEEGVESARGAVPLGVPGASEVEAAGRDALGEVTALEVARDLQLGAPGLAIARIDSLGVAPANVSVELALGRVRGLVALHQGAAAARALAVASELATRQRGGPASDDSHGASLEGGHSIAGELAELEGDVALERDDPARGVAAFGRALAAGRHGVELRVKHAAAALRAGDEVRAQSDLGELEPALATLSTDRAANARFAVLAPLLYRRAIAHSSEDAREKALDVAWRLADPPPELAHVVARFWADRFESGLASDTMVGSAAENETARRRLVIELERMHRAALIDPQIDTLPVWQRIGRQRIQTARSVDPVSMARWAEELLLAWPHHPVVLHLLADARRTASSAERGLLVADALDHLPADGSATPLEVRQEARSLVAFAVDLENGSPVPLFPLDLAARGAVLSRSASSLISVALVALTRDRVAIAHECLDRAAAIPGGLDADRSAYFIAELRLLMAEGRWAEAGALMKTRGSVDVPADVLDSLLLQVARIADAGGLAELLARGRAKATKLTVAAREALVDALTRSGRFAEKHEVEKALRADATPPAQLERLHSLGRELDVGRVVALLREKTDGPGAEAIHALLEAAPSASARTQDIRELIARVPREHVDLVDTEVCRAGGSPDEVAAVLVALGRADEASAHAERLEGTAPDIAALVRIMILVARKDLAGALAQARREYARRPTPSTLTWLLRELVSRNVAAGNPTPWAEVVSLCEVDRTKSPEARYFYGVALLGLGRFDDAAREADGLEAEGSRALAVQLRGEAVERARRGAFDLLDTGDAEDALARVRALERSRLADPESARLLLHLLVRSHHPEEVVQRVDPERAKDPVSLLFLGEALRDLGQLDAALRIADKVRAVEPVWGAKLAVSVLYAEHKTEEGLALARGVHARTHTDGSLLMLSDALEKAGKLGELSGLEPQDPASGEGQWVLIAVARARLTLGQIDAARVTLGRVEDSPARRALVHELEDALAPQK